METFDVVVVGGGGAGLACAARAAELGAAVLVLEKQSELGGTTALAVGSFTAACTSFQRRAGVADDVEHHHQDAGKFGPPEYQARNNDALRRLFLREAAATLDWIVSLGLAFEGPSPEPPNRVPRMHNVVPNATAYVEALAERARAFGAQIACGAAVEELVVEDGRVVGVRADGAGEARARDGVVLAAGDYASSRELISEYRGPSFAAVDGINPNATGDGHRLAQATGVRLVNMDITYGPELRFVPPPDRGEWLHPEDALFADGALLLNREGRRFCDERVSPERELAVAAQPGKVAFLLLDERLASRYAAWPHFISTAPGIAYAYVEDYLRRRPDVAVAGTLSEVTAARGVPAAAVADAAATARRDARWVLLGPVKAYFTTTEGGAAVDESLRVLDDDDRPVPGLYAVGQNGLGGMVLWGHGLHIAWALTSGRLAAETLASRPHV